MSKATLGLSKATLGFRDTVSSMMNAGASAVKREEKIELFTENEAFKSKKIQEARERSKQGMEALQTSLFKWTPDHLSAAAHFDSSAAAYSLAGEHSIAMEMYLQASASHSKAHCDSAAAVSAQKAADMALNMGEKAQAAKLYKDSSDLWALGGEVEKMGSALMLAAKAVEGVDIDKATAFQRDACERLCSMTTPKDRLKTSSVLALDAYRYYFKLLATQFTSGERGEKKVKTEIFQVAKFMCDLFMGFELESSACKMMLSITIFQLHLGDTVLAENTMLNDHFNYSYYLKSKECEVAEELVQSFKNFDIDRLESAQKLTQLNYLDFPEVMQMAKRLSIFKTENR